VVPDAAACVVAGREAGGAGPGLLPVSLPQLRATPEAYTGQPVVFGGEIVRTQIRAHETRIAVLHKPLDTTGRPLVTDQSEGRFLVHCPTFLDPALYAPGSRLDRQRRMG